MSVNTLNKALRMMGCDTGPGGDHCAHGLRSTASTLLNGDIVEAQLAHDTEKKAPAARRGGSAPTWQGRHKLGRPITPSLRSPKFSRTYIISIFVRVPIQSEFSVLNSKFNGRPVHRCYFLVNTRVQLDDPISRTAAIQFWQ
jgi:hypothetical protein